jgi:competence protein ComEC
VPLALITDEEPFEGEFRLITMPRTSASGMTAIAETEEMRFKVFLDQNASVAIGDRLRAAGTLEPLLEGVAPQRGEIGILFPDGPVERLGGPVAPFRQGLAIRKSFLGFLDAYGDPEASAIVQAICFNATHEVSDEVWDDLQKTGTMHIVSTSGLHVVIMFGLLALALAPVPVPLWAKYVLLFGLLLLYAGAAGLRPPIVRAVLMAVVLAVAFLFRRRPDALSALALAGTLQLLVDPELLFGLSFQLSFAAVGGLILFGDWSGWEEPGLWSKIKRASLTTAQTSLIATLATGPILAYWIGRVSLIAPVTNVLILLVLPPAVAGSLTAWLLHFVAPAMGVGLLKVAVEPMAGYILANVRFMADLPLAAVDFPAFSAYWLIPTYGLLLLVWKFKRRPA